MIALTARDSEPGARLDKRFGRCEFFSFYDPETGKTSSLKNPSRLQGGGAGVKSAEFLAGKGVALLITGNVGPKALKALNAAGIEVFASTEKTVEQALQRHKEGKLEKISHPTVGSHFGAKKEED